MSNLTNLITMFRLALFACVLLHNVYSIELQNEAFYKDVEIDTGRVRGFLVPHEDYFSYLGIPYAEPPVGNRRFKAPVPSHPWNELFIANRTVICPQRGDGDEDCLVVNVFTPAKSLSGPVPVLFYIHGGSFLTGSGQTKGVESLMKRNLIVVTLNYRLGVLGFLCLGIEEAPGNAGLKDQVAALEWVQRNIDNFGGDPNNVTIYGMSAGATSVEMLIASKMAKGLFHKAIVESGAASAVWSLDDNPINTAETLARSLDIKKEFKKLNQLINYYLEKPASELSVANYELYQNLTGGKFGFVPCLERKLRGIEPFLTDNFNDVLPKMAHNFSMLFIYATFEGLFLRSSDYHELNYRDKMNARFEDFMPVDLIFDSEEIRSAITEKVKWFYFGDKPVGDDTLIEYLDYFGDHLVLQPLLNSAITHSKNGDSVYMMEFAYKGELGGYDNIFVEVNGAGHGDAVKYAILNKQIQNINDEVMVERMSNILANFVKYGNPSPARSELIPKHWPKVQPDHVTYLRLDKKIQVLEFPFWERKVFWDELYETYGRKVSPLGLGSRT